MADRPVLVLADTFREAERWARDHGVPPSGVRHVRDWQDVRGRSDGVFVDLRRATIDPQGVIAYLDAMGFVELLS